MAVETTAAAARAALRSARSLAGAGAVVAVASMAVNGLAAVVPVLAAGLLPPAQVGALVALLGVGAVASVVGTGLQTALAVRWARQATVAGAGRVSLLTAGLTTGALLFGVPMIAWALHVPALQAVLLALLTGPVILAGRWLGELQGRQSYGRLAAGMLLLGFGRYGGVLAALAVGLGVTASLAVGAGASVASVVVIAALPGTNAGAPTASGQDRERRVRAREVLRAGGASIAMLAISYADLLLAQALLPGADAGAYAVGSVLSKGALWAPGALTVLALPMFARARRHAVRITLACTAACGVVLIGASALFADLAVGIVGRGQYPHLAGYAPAFATVGALYALVFVLVNAEIAAHVARPALWLWIALGAMVAAAVVVRPTTVGGVLTLSIITATLTLAATTAARAVRGARAATRGPR
ncbi:MAG TPA: polysaccharide biosynthesis protein [Micromonosporaceae bacterium]|jgi:O-antigen/teichoic acid export membrane protein